MANNEIVNDPELIAYCGLYCGSCSRYKKGKCQGCKKNNKASWCKVRSCNIDSQLTNCAHCSDISINQCKKLNNPVGKIFEIIFGSNRLASLNYIKDNGEDLYTKKMCSLGQMSIKRAQKI